MTTDSIQKRCSGCKEYFPATPEYFHRNKFRKDGLSLRCASCDNASSARYRSANRAAANEASKKSREKKPEYYRTIKADWQRGHPANARAAGVRYRKRNPGADMVRYHRRKKENIEHMRLVWAMGSRRRRALMRKAEGVFTVADLKRINEEQEGRCFYCGMALLWHIRRQVHADHFIPLIRGGTNWPDNIVLACQFCNTSKKDKLYEEWRAVRGW